MNLRIFTNEIGRHYFTGRIAIFGDHFSSDESLEIPQFGMKHSSNISVAAEIGFAGSGPKFNSK